jgi:hypothetical protein
MGLALSGERVLLDIWSRLRGGIPWRPPALVATLPAWMATQFVFMQQAHLLRSPNVGSAFHLWREMWTGGLSFRLLTGYDLLLVLMIGAGVIASEWIVTHWNPRQVINPSRLAVGLRPAYVFTLMLLTLFFGYASFPAASDRADPTNAHQRFIYFQF